MKYSQKKQHLINFAIFILIRVVKSVLAKEEAQLDDNEWIQPSNDDNPDSDNEEIAPAEYKRTLRRQSSFDMSIKTGATRVMNPKNKKRMETCLIENDYSDQLQTILATETDDVEEQSWIQPGSTAEEGDDTSEMEPSSLLHDFKETIAEKLHHLHLPHHEPRSEIRDKHGLLEAAMETMLMEQAEIMGATKPPHEPVKFEDKRNTSIESFKKLLAAPFRRRSNDSGDLKHSVKKPVEPKNEKFGLFDSAMKTMLIETAHIIEGVGVHPKSIDEDDKAIAEMFANQSNKINPTEALTDENATDEIKSSNKKDAPVLKTSESYSNFCNNLISSHVLTNANDTETTSPTAIAGNKSSNEMPILVLTHCASNTNMTTNSNQVSSDGDATKQPNTIDSKNLSPNICHDRVSVDIKHNNNKRSPKPIRKSNHANNIQNNNLGHSNLTRSKSSTSINKTNKTKLLAPNQTQHSNHRSNDDKIGTNEVNHVKSEAIGTKTLSSPTKVPTSSSSYNTASSATATTITLSSSKDGKDSKETICRRSSDSDLNVTPKGKLVLLIILCFVVM